MAHAESSTVSTSLFPNKCLIALYKVLSGRLQVMTAANQICLLILGLNHFAISQNKLREMTREIIQLSVFGYFWPLTLPTS